jgi:PPE-repeat protein
MSTDKIRGHLVSLLATVTLLSCGPQSSTVPPSPIAVQPSASFTSTPATPTPFPPTATVIPPSPTPVSPVPIAPTVPPTVPAAPTNPTVSSATSQVKGILLTKGTQQPVVGARVALIPVTSEKIGPFDENSPQTNSDNTGAFLIKNVPTGKYVVAAGGFLSLMRNDSGGVIVIEVTPDQTLDLGNIPVEN